MAVTKRKRKTNPYRAEVFVEGVRVASRGFPTAAAAHKWHDETKKRFESGRGPAGELTLADVVAEYEAKELPTKRASTRRRSKLALELVKAAPIMRVAMADLTSKHVDELMDWLLAHERAGSRDRLSFDKELKVLRAVITRFREMRDETVAMPVTKRHWKRSRFKEAPRRRPDFFIPEDKVMPWFRALLEERDPVFHGLAVVQVLMGYRIGEATALRWPAVDLERDRMVVEATMEWFDDTGRYAPEVGDRTKTEASRRMAPIPPMVKAVLQAAKGRWPLSMEVFRTRTGRLVRDGAVRAKYKTAFRKVGLDWTGTHVCRHTHATIGLAATRQSEVRVSLGHTSERETERYAHAAAMLKNSVPRAIESSIRSAATAAGDHAQNHAHAAEGG